MDVPGFEERGKQTGCLSRRWTEAMRTHRAAAACGGLNQSILKGDRKGQHSIRINNQWRICFTWKSGDAHDVEIVDYH